MFAAGTLICGLMLCAGVAVTAASLRGSLPLAGAPATPATHVLTWNVPALNGVLEQHPWHMHGGAFWALCHRSGHCTGHILCHLAMGMAMQLVVAPPPTSRRRREKRTPAR